MGLSLATAWLPPVQEGVSHSQFRVPRRGGGGSRPRPARPPKAPLSPPLERRAGLTHKGTRAARRQKSTGSRAHSCGPDGRPSPSPAKGASEGGKKETPTEGEASPTRAPAPHRASRSLHLGGRRQLVPATAPTAATRASPIDCKATLRQA